MYSAEKAGLAEQQRWVDLIEKSWLLGVLDRPARARLVELSAFRRLASGQVLMRQGERGDTACLVLEGELEVIVETPLGEVVVACLGAQAIVGEIAILSDLPRTATVRALGEALVLEMRGENIQSVIREHPEAAFGMLSAMGRRLASLNQPLAMLTLATQALERSDFDVEEMEALFAEVEGASMITQSLRKLVVEMQDKQSRRQEMVVAARLQQSVLPRQIDFSRLGAPYTIEAMMRPSRDVGGDFYDFFFSDAEDKVFLVVADVSGKGIPAALFMAISRTLIRSALSSGLGLEAGLSQANSQLEAQNPECLFVTVFAAELDLKSGVLTYVNAGHCDGYVLTPQGEISLLTSSAPALGFLPLARFTAASAPIQAGDRLVLISDGITEAFSAAGEIYGEDRLVALLKGFDRMTARATLEGVDADVVAFSEKGVQSDDITCLVLERL